MSHQRVNVLFDGWKTFCCCSSPQCPGSSSSSPLSNEVSIPRVLEVTLVEHCAADVIEIIPFDTLANIEAQRLYVTASSLNTLLQESELLDKEKDDEKTRKVNFLLRRLQFLQERNQQQVQEQQVQEMGEGKEEEGKEGKMLSPTTRWRTQLIPKRSDRIDPIHGWLTIQCHKPLDIQNICVKRDKSGVNLQKWEEKEEDIVDLLPMEELNLNGLFFFEDDYQPPVPSVFTIKPSPSVDESLLTDDRSLLSFANSNFRIGYAHSPLNCESYCTFSPGSNSLYAHEEALLSQTVGLITSPILSTQNPAIAATTVPSGNEEEKKGKVGQLRRALQFAKHVVVNGLFSSPIASIAKDEKTVRGGGDDDEMEVTKRAPAMRESEVEVKKTLSFLPSLTLAIPALKPAHPDPLHAVTPKDSFQQEGLFKHAASFPPTRPSGKQQTTPTIRFALRGKNVMLRENPTAPSTPSALSPAKCKVTDETKQVLENSSSPVNSAKQAQSPSSIPFPLL
eukprot:scaffold2306_cov179-Ochromonas_danica.AAC.3